MLRCKRTVEVSPLNFQKCGGKVIEDITFKDEETKQHGMVLSCLMCADEVIVPLKEWNAFKKRLDVATRRIRLGKIKGQQALPIAFGSHLQNKQN